MKIRHGAAWLGSALLIAAAAVPAGAAGPADRARPAAETAAAPSTSPTAKAAVMPDRRAAAPPVTGGGPQTITFSEFPVGTVLAKQYHPRGIAFSGAGGGGAPFISNDTSNPSAPVLSGSPQFQGAVQGQFIKPGGKPRTVGQFGLTVGYIDDPNSVVVTAHDLQGKEIARKSVDRTGIVPVVLKVKGIASFRVQSAAGERAGFAIDNVSYFQPDVLVGLGDSYSSGEANPPYVKGTELTTGNGCHRSVNAWPVRLVKGNKVVKRSQHFACSGALTSALNGTFKGEQPQLTALGKLQGANEPGVVTLSMGGNDLGFSTVVEACVKPWGKCLGDDGEVKKAENRLPGLSAKLKGLYESVQKKAPNATVIVVSYPRLFPETEAEEDCSWLNEKERVALNALGAQVNDAIAARAREAGVEFVDVRNSTDNHEMCTENVSWFWGIGARGGQQRAHPILEGQKAIEATVRAHLDKLAAPTS
ncbi:SGNH/GDSL hydrolase family protein [Streptomyces qinzhouensis]|uniref:SGNH/GDSL hydrolase family protein n=1 Tax=Streptomyces qinzhouensis TaxID=2599401 RepID=A0A5B8JCK8_9ACTN|nr:SGNH/GDSL hydrolase family protein [Streptomyces qinzhouensis]QDY75380.1 SGNH/GDSL hydrolase family protein [Streptomyces qinzhouensis]